MIDVEPSDARRSTSKVGDCNKARIRQTSGGSPALYSAKIAVRPRLPRDQKISSGIKVTSQNKDAHFRTMGVDGSFIPFLAVYQLELKGYQ